jgi:uncharacterized protein (DUF58 family)
MSLLARRPLRVGSGLIGSWVAEHPLVRRAKKIIFQPRGPEAGEVFLNQRRVFVLPTGAGLLFAAMLIALLLGSINYQLSLGFVLTFLMGSIAWIGMFYTFRNLAHLTLRPGRVEAVFAGEIAEFGIVIRSTSRFDRYAVSLSADAELAPVWADPAAGGETAVRIPVRVTERGWHAMPRVTLETSFPLGLWRAWSYWQPEMSVLGFPTPGPEGEPLPRSHADDPGGAEHTGKGAEDFAGVRSYAPGDSPRHLAWKAMARDPEGALLIKLLDGASHTQIWLDLANVPPHHGLEAALSCMTRWVLECESEALRYGLRLGAVSIAPALGPAHATACLTALALYAGRR